MVGKTDSHSRNNEIIENTIIIFYLKSINFYLILIWNQISHEISSSSNKQKYKPHR